MRKISMLLAIGAMIGFASCKKEFTCTCNSVSSSTPYEKTGKGDNASEACQDAANTILGIPTEVCVAK